MEKHIIALDLDGTLLTDQKTISEKNLKTIQAAKEAGHIVVIATGRPHRGSKQYYAQMDLTTPMVNMNGAYVHHPRDKSWGVKHSPMPKDTAYDIFDIANHYGSKNIMAEIIDQVYIEKNDESHMTNFFTAGLEESAIFGDLKENLKTDPSSILIYPDKEAVPKIQEALNENHASLIDHRKWMDPFNVVEVIRSGLHKAIGLQMISKYYDIPQERIIAFGDEDNDLEMIEYAGVGVAMGNGIDELKTLAKETTLTNQEDGISHFLEDYLRLNKKQFSKN
ncbi:HAD family phosphatase [Allobacillus sp. SKP2-8]|uniref:Cof-type HAD-IIB family hydrolase n=1 Tax=unclassified Allobacillus TaxID=2628859 RepID=UPI0011839DC0|nr:Cof-type HAD-IIB family hydrolase [Allobacillus sp. SKP2-8]TSJ63460.1 HAD family phosphatase [Allobacillus sp. SKP2-8]